MNRLGRYLKRLRRQKHWTVRHLGKRVGYTGSYISQMERGQRAVSIPRLYRLIVRLEGDMLHALILLAQDQGVPPRVLTVELPGKMK